MTVRVKSLPPFTTATEIGVTETAELFLVARSKLISNIFAALIAYLASKSDISTPLFEPRSEKPVFGFSDQVPHKSGCIATEDD